MDPNTTDQPDNTGTTDNPGSVPDPGDDAPITAGFLPVHVPDANPYGEIFSGIAFRLSEGKKAYDRSDGSKTKRIGVAQILLATAKGRAVATINGSLSAVLHTNGTVDLEVRPLGNGQTRQSSILPVGTRAEYDQWLHAAALAGDKWLSGQSLQAQVSAPTATQTKHVGSSFFGGTVPATADAPK